MSLSEKGFTTGTMVAGLAALGLTLMYTQHQTQQTVDKVKEARTQEDSFDKNNMHLSNLALLKAAMQPAKRGTAYMPSLYATDYFADSWRLEENAKAPVKNMSMSGQIVKMKVLDGSLVDPRIMGAVISGEKQKFSKPSQQEMKVYSLNHDSTHPFWVRSVDVNSKIVTDGKQSVANGRIPIDAPVPYDIKIAVKAPGASDFKIYGRNDNLPETGNPSGTYTFRVLGSGVVLYSEVIIDGVVQTLGMNQKEMKITHDARSVASIDKVIGEFQVPIEAKTTTSTSSSSSGSGSGGGSGVGTPGIGGNDGNDSCQIGSDNAQIFSQGLGTVGGGAGSAGGTGSRSTTTTTTTTTTPTTVSLVVKLFAVDGQEATDITLKKSLTVGSKESKSVSSTKKGDADADKGYNNCSEYCPMNIVSDFDNNIQNMAAALDRGAKTEADYRKVDFYNPSRTADTLDTSKIPGIICDNFDLAGKAMFSNTGLLASTLLQNDKSKYMANWNQYKSMYQSYIYIAPKCNRTVINERTSCGCFAEDTEILLPDGNVARILDLRQGDWVWNPKARKAQMIKKVVRGPELIPMYEITAGGKPVLVTHGHPFLGESGLLAARDIKIGQTIMQGESSVIVENVREIPVSDPAPVVWNIELDGSEDEAEHYVLANGVMTGDLYLQQKLDGKK